MIVMMMIRLYPTRLLSAISRYAPLAPSLQLYSQQRRSLYRDRIERNLASCLTRFCRVQDSTKSLPGRLRQFRQLVSVESEGGNETDNYHTCHESLNDIHYPVLTVAVFLGFFGLTAHSSTRVSITLLPPNLVARAAINTMIDSPIAALSSTLFSPSITAPARRVAIGTRQLTLWV